MPHADWTLSGDSHANSFRNRQFPRRTRLETFSPVAEESESGAVESNRVRCCFCRGEVRTIWVNAIEIAVRG